MEKNLYVFQILTPLAAIFMLLPFCRKKLIASVKIGMCSYINLDFCVEHGVQSEAWDLKLLSDQTWSLLGILMNMHMAGYGIYHCKCK